MFQLLSAGQLGDVMKESANLAMNWVKSHASEVCLFTYHYQSFFQDKPSQPSALPHMMF